MWGGASEFDTRLVNEARAQLRAYEQRFEFTYLTALPMDALLKELSQLPPRSIVLYSTIFRDGAAEAFVPHQAAERISAAASVPVYGFIDQYLGHGIVGGRVYSVSAHGEEAARLALQVLAGRSPSELAPVAIGTGQTILDWRQLQRWDISESRLPPDAIVRFRPPLDMEPIPRLCIRGSVRCGLAGSADRWPGPAACSPAAGGIGVG